MDFKDMFEDYIKSDLGCELLVTEWGYGVYQVVNEDLYITNIYLKPEYRGLPIVDLNNPFCLTAIAIRNIAKERGAKYHFEKLDLETNKKKDRIMKYLMFDGFKLSHAEGQFLVLVKGI